MGDAAVVLMHPLMVLVRGIGGGAIASATGAKARIGGAHRVEYSYYQESRTAVILLNKTQ